MEIAQRKALITGGASGIGFRIGQRFTEGGCRVAVMDCDPEKLTEAEQKLSDAFGTLCDVSDPDDVESAVEKVFSEFGSVDILVNSAGIMRSSPLVNVLRQERHPLDMWRQVIDINLSGVFYVSAAVAERMVRQRTKGVIVNISSISARGNAGQTAYSASKAGVEAMTKVWAKELGPLGIRCAAVAPGFINTAATAEALERERLQKWIDQVPLRHMGEIDEIVEAILFVISNDYFNGKVLAVDGGLSL